MRYLILAVIVTLNCSAYCDRGVTASGEPVQDGICAVDRINGVLVPFGTKIALPDGRILTVTDRFGDGRNNALDIFLDSESECWEWGRRWVKCKIETPL